MPMTENVSQELKHELRAALKHRELSDTVSTHRRGGLRIRRDMEGVELGVDWEKSRCKLDNLPPFEEGVMIDILAGGTITKERLVRHGRLKNCGDKCTFPQCTTREREDRRHRWFFCAQFENLRTDTFKKFRDREDELHECERQCGIVLDRSFWKGDAEEIHGVLLNIELKARELQDAEAEAAAKGKDEEGTAKAYKSFFEETCRSFF